MKTQRVADIVVGCGVALFGIFILYASMFITGGPHIACLPAPSLWSSVFCFSSAESDWPSSTGVYGGRISQSIGRTGRGSGRSWSPSLSLGCYIALMNPLGLPLATFVYLAFSIWYLKRSKWLMAIVISLITAVISYYLFIRLLGLSFPDGFPV